MDCSSSTLPSSIPIQSNQPVSQRDRRVVPLTSDDYETPNDVSNKKQSSQTSIRIRNGQLINVDRPKRQVIYTISLQLTMSTTTGRASLPNGGISSARRALVLNTAHDTVLSFATFSGLGSFPYLLYDVVSYDKLQTN